MTARNGLFLMLSGDSEGIHQNRLTVGLIGAMLLIVSEVGTNF